MPTEFSSAASCLAAMSWQCQRCCRPACRRLDSTVLLSKKSLSSCKRLQVLLGFPVCKPEKTHPEANLTRSVAGPAKPNWTQMLQEFEAQSLANLSWAEAPEGCGLDLSWLQTQHCYRGPFLQSSFHFLFHYPNISPNITPIYCSSFHFLLHYLNITPIYPIFFSIINNSGHSPGRPWASELLPASRQPCASRTTCLGLG